MLSFLVPRVTLAQRLTDLRFLSIDFLNTFLLTYRVFAEGVQVAGPRRLHPRQVLEALKTVFFNPEPALSPSSSCGWVLTLGTMNANMFV